MAEKQYINNPSDIRLNDDQELQQILGNPPGWLLNWGNTFILVGVVVMLVLGWLVKYPDVISARVVLTTEEPPIRVFAERAGKLSTFMVRDQSVVKKGQILALLDNPANLSDVSELDSFLLEIESYSYSDPEMTRVNIPRNLQLGNLQAIYADFSKSFDEHKFFIKNNNTYSKIENLNLQIARLVEIGLSLGGQVKTLNKVVLLARKELERKQELRKIGDISQAELETAQGDYLKSQRQLETVNNQIINNNLLIEQTRMQILDHRQKYTDGKSSGLFSIQEDIQNIRGEVDSWKKRNLIVAPISGKVSLNKFRSAQQYINQNEELLTIVPGGNSAIIAKGTLLSRGSGKVKQDMKVNIRLDGYSYQEFGSIPAKVKMISLVAQGDGFLVEMSVEQPLKTTYGNVIPFQQEMQGTANIITEDRRILARVFDRILSVLYN